MSKKKRRMNNSQAQQSLKVQREAVKPGVKSRKTRKLKQKQQITIKLRQNLRRTQNLEQKPSNTKEPKHQRKHTETMQPIPYLKEKFSVLPAHWLYIEQENKIVFMRVDPKSEEIKNHIVINEDLSVTVICPNEEKFSLNRKLSSPDKIFNYLKSVEKWPLCVGTRIEKERYSKQCRRIIVGDEVCKRNQVYPQCKHCRLLRCRLQKREDPLINSNGQNTYKHEAFSGNILRNSKHLNETSSAFHIGKLSEEWLVDMFCRISEELHCYLKNIENINDIKCVVTIN